jgi:hypothetical protein
MKKIILLLSLACVGALAKQKKEKVVIDNLDMPKISVKDSKSVHGDNFFEAKKFKMDAGQKMLNIKVVFKLPKQKQGALVSSDWEINKEIKLSMMVPLNSSNMTRAERAEVINERQYVKDVVKSCGDKNRVDVNGAGLLPIALPTWVDINNRRQSEAVIARNDVAKCTTRIIQDKIETGVKIRLLDYTDGGIKIAFIINDLLEMKTVDFAEMAAIEVPVFIAVEGETAASIEWGGVEKLIFETVSQGRKVEIFVQGDERKKQSKV